MSQPKISRAHWPSPVWIVPLVTLLIGGWLLMADLLNRGPEITIDFADGSGVEAGKTMLEYKGVAVGSVTHVELQPDLRDVTVTVRLKKDAGALARAGAQFWIERPEVSFAGVRGLDTLLTGVYLAVNPGQGAPATAFKGLDQPAPPEDSRLGRTFVLVSPKLGALTPGASVYYRELKIGAVEASALADDATSVLVRVRVFAQYVALVRTNTVFWNSGGLSMKVGLFGADIRTTSLESLITGGVSLATPDGALAPEAPDGAQFPLHDEAESTWTQWKPKLPLSNTAVGVAPAAPPPVSGNEGAATTDNLRPSSIKPQ